MTKPTPTCGEHHTPKEWRKAVFEYQDNGIVIRVPDVYAWVCPEDGEASFTPETVDELIATVPSSGARYSPNTLSRWVSRASSQTLTSTPHRHAPEPHDWETMGDEICWSYHWGGCWGWINGHERLVRI